MRTTTRKVREGVVTSAAMEKTAVVEITIRTQHPRYKKTVQHSKKYFAHDENNDANVGDTVRITETRPLSKLKRWRISEIVERAR